MDIVKKSSELKLDYVKAYREAEFPAYSELQSTGHVLIHNVQAEECPRILSSIGNIVSRPNGESSYNVKAETGYADYYFTKSTNGIGCHTEEPYLATPPRYLALYCIEPAQCGGGQTKLYCPMNDYIRHLSMDDMALLKNIQVQFKANQNAVTNSIFDMFQANYPLLQEDDNGKKILRYSHNLFFYGDINANIKGDDRVIRGLHPQVQKIIKEINSHYQENSLNITIPKSSLLIWDNHRLLHGRSPFMDTRRHLERYCLSDTATS